MEILKYILKQGIGFVMWYVVFMIIALIIIYSVFGGGCCGQTVSW